MILPWSLIGCSDSGNGAGQGGSGGTSSNGGNAGSGASGGSSNGGSSNGGDSGSGGDGGRDAGPSAPGWLSDYVDGSSAISCSADLESLRAQAAPRVEIDGVTLVVGYEQVGDNQNPLVVRFEGDDQIYCRRHETSGPDGRAWGVTWNGGAVAYVVYTVVGGGTELENRNGWLSSYAPGSISGGGPRVSYVGRVSVADGELESGSLIIAVKSDNKVNSHSPAGAITVRADGNVEFLGSSAHKPIDVNQKAMSCTDYPFNSRYVFTPALDQVLCADCSNCESTSPCE